MLVKYVSCDTLGSLCDTKKKICVLEANHTSDGFLWKT